MSKKEREQYAKKTRITAFIAAPLMGIFCFIYIIFVVKIFPAPNEWPIISGGVGTMLIFFSILNFFADKQIAMKKRTEASLFIIGFLMLVISLILLYT